MTERITRSERIDMEIISNLQREKIQDENRFGSHQWQRGCIGLYDSIKGYNDLKRVLSNGDVNEKIYTIEHIVPLVFCLLDEPRRKGLFGILQKNLHDHRMCDNSGYAIDPYTEQEDAESVDDSARDLLTTLNYFGIREIKDLYGRLEWEAVWQFYSPSISESSTETGNVRTWDEVDITFEPAIKALDELKKLLSPFHVEYRSIIRKSKFGNAYVEFADRMLRAKQQYRGEEVEDYLTSPEFIEASRHRQLSTNMRLLKIGTGYKMGRVISGREYLEKIDNLAFYVLEEERFKQFYLLESKNLNENGRKE